MKQKFNLSKLFKATFLVIFLMVEFFGFGGLPKAQAACSYSVQFNEFDGKTSVTPSDSLHFVTQVIRQGTTTECESSVNIRLRLKSTAFNGYQEIAQEYQNFKTVSGLGSTAISTQNVDVGKLDRSQLPQANVLEFYTYVTPYGSLTDVAGNAPHVIIKVTGALNSSGTVGLNVFLKDPTNNSLNTGTFKSGDAIQIMFQADPNGVQSLGGNTTDDVYISFYINDLSKPISSFTKTKGQLDNKNSQWADFTVNTASGFKDGVNTVQVKLFEPNTNVSLGQGTATVNITGLGTPVSTTPGSKPIGADCSDSSECTTNFCWDQGNNKLTCAACNSDASCNSDGPGFTCNASGVCVKANTPAATTTPVGMQGNAKDKLYNPLPEEDLVHTFLLIAQGFLTILGIFAVVFIIAGGFQLVIAAGNEEAIIKGKKMITWAIIGLVIALLSFSIISIVENFLQVSIQAPPPLGYNSNPHVIARSASDVAISNKI